MAQEGLTIGGLLDSIAILASQALQHGIPLDVLIRKFIHQRFEPSGHTDNPNIPTTSSIIDYIFRWLDWQFTPSAKTREQTGEHPAPPQVIP
jgi:ribonucleoside-diphosphate reductase alpha chain